MNIKKINYLLIVFTLICAFFKIFSELDEGIVIILKDSSIVFTIFLPYIVKKYFKLDINDNLIFLWIIFIFLAHYLGVICEFYFKFYAYDKVTHTFSGVLSGSVALLIIDKIKSKNFWFNILFILSFTWFCAGMWEVFEYLCNILFGGDAQRVVETGVNDTMLDMIVAFFGSLFVCLLYYVNCVKEKELL
ncbi:MAG: hypothetical protein IKF82_08455 [Bacilli bacterium]|nr:hypothetical protein [Bacilli bacterium]